jgi:hypothetical protein
LEKPNIIYGSARAFLAKEVGDHYHCLTVFDIISSIMAAEVENEGENRVSKTDSYVFVPRARRLPGRTPMTPHSSADVSVDHAKED